MNEQALTSVNKPLRDKKGRLLPGNTANPNGRPEGSLSITAEIKKKLEECPEGKEKTYLAYLIDQILKKSVIEGDQQTIKQIWNYIDGMPRQDITSGGEKIQQVPIYGGESVPKHNGDETDIPTSKAD